VAAQNVDLNAEQESLLVEVEKLERQRQSALEGIPAELLGSYDKLRRTRFGVAVTIVRDGSCGACGTVLTAALAQEARMPSKVSYCNTCGRILYAS
jgi:predicted  nucleic acid-binding Zn-ribbon protein